LGGFIFVFINCCDIRCCHGVDGDLDFGNSIRTGFTTGLAPGGLAGGEVGALPLAGKVDSNITLAMSGL